MRCSILNSRSPTTEIAYIQGSGSTYISTLFNIRPYMEGCGVSYKIRPLYLRKLSLQYPLNRGLAGSQDLYEGNGKQKIVESVGNGTTILIFFSQPIMSFEATLLAYFYTRPTMTKLTFRSLTTYIYILLYIYINICCTAALTSRRYILNINSTNIHTEYFKHAA